MKTELVEEEIQAAVERRLGLTHVSWIQADRESTRVTLRSLINGLYEAAAATHIVVLEDAAPLHKGHLCIALVVEQSNVSELSDLQAARLVLDSQR